MKETTKMTYFDAILCRGFIVQFLSDNKTETASRFRLSKRTLGCCTKALESYNEFVEELNVRHCIKGQHKEILYDDKGRRLFGEAETLALNKAIKELKAREISIEINKADWDMFSEVEKKWFDIGDELTHRIVNYFIEGVPDFAEEKLNIVKPKEKSKMRNVAAAIVTCLLLFNIYGAKAQNNITPSQPMSQGSGRFTLVRQGVFGTLGNVSNAQRDDEVTPLGQVNSRIATLIASTRGYSRYDQMLSDTNTAKPYGTVLINDLDTVTFTWSRSGAGVYVLTASSAAFTADKTFVTMQPPPAALIQYKIVMTSTSSITLSTYLLSNVTDSVLTASGRDSLVNKTLFSLRIYN